ncbi:ead/Ea22-like family protein [Enterobacter asburiae]|uniref:ead/Ea22-like family protein n=1 Tax=Enterobacter asburiae TaxID=61645 RepID=UPI00210D6891|nr:ead/Ea22-like family protein [Enterobacter asburiae]MCQ4368927.1 ead/Ea22-like family protein [Enterobacter asburiae]
MTNSPMSNIDKRALRKAAEQAGADEWCAFIDTKSKTYSVHTPGDNRCGDVVKWAGFDGQQRAAAKAKFIAAANPATVLALLDELEAKNQRNAELEAREKSLRTVGVMSQKAFQRLEGRESRFIALWPRPEIYLPRKRPEDGVIVYARVAGTAKGE